MVRRREIDSMKEIVTTVSRSGNGGCVYVPKQWIGKRVKVTLLSATATARAAGDKRK